MPDVHVLQMAAADGRVMVTSDKDFGNFANSAEKSVDSC
jgi:predicted nuclease of predicted toxin-antitoxin system